MLFQVNSDRAEAEAQTTRAEAEAEKARTWAASAATECNLDASRSRRALALTVTTQLAQVRKSGNPRLYHFDPQVSYTLSVLSESVSDTL